MRARARTRLTEEDARVRVRWSNTYGEVSCTPSGIACILRRAATPFNRAAVYRHTVPYLGSLTGRVIYLAEITDNYFARPRDPSSTSSETSPLTLITPHTPSGWRGEAKRGGQSNATLNADQRYPREGCLFFDNAALAYVPRMGGYFVLPSTAASLRDGIKINPRIAFRDYLRHRSCWTCELQLDELRPST